ncbi:carboxymuconolactone decarboxylase family protein [Thermogemmatispora sp.]|uniref:carboxymuconolactone decarboxylase family protein n=1 Tax=Thermogemmatispora sp. TaxID=1968838 RepID=UPI001D1CA981|nr:carboxymuconolactone decarboxylase family protein [Thermogemmatispora sp.]MBX5448819.1 carboxymuconolactone decarboxylase family protein [Thermogemmatispora sp.]
MAAHTALAGQLGVSEELLDALYHIDTHRHLFTAREQVALRFAEIMTTAARDIDEELWDELQAHFDDGEIVELAMVIGLFNCFNRFADALRLEPPARSKGEGSAQARASEKKDTNTYDHERGTTEGPDQGSL